MKLGWKTTALIAGLLLVTRSVAPAAVFDDKSPAQKLRADVANQLAAYVKCLTNVASACEKTGINVGIECNLETGATAPPADPKGTFAAQIAKCDAKLNFNRKGPKGNSSVQNYELIGCPRYEAGARFADMDEFEAEAGFLKNMVTGFVGNVASASACTDNKSCKADTKILMDLYRGLVKCQTACENDYKGKKGNGGPTDDLLQCGSTGDLAVQACAFKPVNKYLDKAADWPARNFAAFVALQEADALIDGLFNAPDDCN